MVRDKYLLCMRGAALTAQSVFGAYVGGRSADDPVRRLARDPEASAWTCIVDTDERRVRFADCRVQFDYQLIKSYSDELAARSILLYPFINDGAVSVLVAIASIELSLEELEGILVEAFSPLLSIVASVRSDCLVDERPVLVALRPGVQTASMIPKSERIVVVSEFDELEASVQSPLPLAVGLAQGHCADGQFTSLGDSQRLFVFERENIQLRDGCKAVICASIPMELVVGWLSERTIGDFFRRRVYAFDGILLVDDGEDGVTSVVFGPHADRVRASDRVSAC